jgi:hypothetical protein
MKRPHLVALKLLHTNEATFMPTTLDTIRATLGPVPQLEYPHDNIDDLFIVIERALKCNKTVYTNQVKVVNCY